MITSVSLPDETYQKAKYLAEKLTEGNFSALVKLLVELATEEEGKDVVVQR